MSRSVSARLAALLEYGLGDLDGDRAFDEIGSQAELCDGLLYRAVGCYGADEQVLGADVVVPVA